MPRLLGHHTLPYSTHPGLNIIWGYFLHPATPEFMDLPMAVYKYTRTVIAVLCTQESEITVSLSAGQTAGSFNSVSISVGYQTQRQFWATQISSLPGKS